MQWGPGRPAVPLWRFRGGAAPSRPAARAEGRPLLFAFWRGRFWPTPQPPPSHCWSCASSPFFSVCFVFFCWGVGGVGPLVGPVLVTLPPEKDPPSEIIHTRQYPARKPGKIATAMDAVTGPGAGIWMFQLMQTASSMGSTNFWSDWLSLKGGHYWVAFWFFLLDHKNFGNNVCPLIS